MAGRYSKKRIKSTLVAVTLMAILGCAQIGRPKGGPKDITPPKIIEMFPKNNSTHFKGNSFTVSFDEYIKVNGGREAVMVSPLLKRTPVITSYGDEIKVLFEEDTLLENTTYNFNFGQNIVDNNEGNPLKNFRYIFSTGSVIDSGYVEGTLTHIRTGDLVKNAKIMLYRITTDTLTSNDIDSLVIDAIPTYFYQTVDTNYFRIENIAPAKYYMVALKEEDKDYHFIPGDDKIVAYDSLIDLKESFKTDLQIYPTKRYFRYIPNANNDQLGSILFSFEGMPQDVSVQRMDSLWMPYDVPKAKVLFSKTRDSLFYWYQPKGEDSLNFMVYKGDITLDTVVIKTRKYDTLDLEVNSLVSGTLDFNKPFFLETNFPIHSIDTGLVKATVSDSVPISFSYKIDSLTQRKAQIYWDLKPNSKYKFEFYPNSFKSNYGFFLDTLTVNLNIPKLEIYANLEFRIKLPKRIKTEQFIFQLSTQKDRSKVVRSQVVRREKNNLNLTMSYVRPGSYLVQLVEDKNKNGKWDTGDYFKHLKPEPFIFYQDTVSLKANWDIIQDWAIKD